MACFIVPAAEAAVTTVITRVLEKREADAFRLIRNEASDPIGNIGSDSAASVQAHSRFTAHTGTTETLSSKLRRLNGLLWGGSALLAFEHLWHGEIQPFFPFLTAASDPAETAAMLSEMSTAGVMMAVIVTAVWGISVIVSDAAKKRHSSISAVPTAEVEV